MSRTTERRRLADLPSRAAVWLAGVLLTGYVFHGLTRGDLRRLDAREAAIHLGSLGVVALAVGYLVFMVPRAYAVGLVAVVGYVVALRAGLVAVQWLGVKVIESRQ